MRFFTFLLALCILFNLSAEDDVDLTLIPYDLFSEPTTYVDGVNVISGHFTYSTTDMTVEGPKSVRLKRTYLQGYSGSLGKCWETSLAGEFELNESFNKAHIIHGPYIGLTYVSKNNVLKLDEKAFKKGLTNAHGRINGKTHPKNTQIQFADIDNAKIHTGSGSTFSFKKASNHFTYKWFEERHPDGFKTLFDGQTLSTQTCAELRQPMIRTLRKKNREFQSTHYQDVIGLREVKNHFQKDAHTSLLCSVERPAGPDESYTYTQLNDGTYCLSNITRPDGRYVFLNYYYEGKDSGKVRTLCAPANILGLPLTTKKFIYHDRRTVVVNAANNPTVYFFDKQFRLTSFKRHFQTKCYSTDHLTWGTGEYKGNLTNRIHFTSNSTPLFCRHLDYDVQGNITSESLWGNLTGNNKNALCVGIDYTPLSNGCDCLEKHFTYSQDGLNLLLKETDDRTQTVYTYTPGTNQLIAKLVWTSSGIQRRFFYQYDQDGFLSREIEDDGCQQEADSLAGITERHIKEITYTQSPPYGLQQSITEKCLDLATGKEITLSRIERAYSPQGQLIEEKHFNANETYLGSITRQYDSKGHCIEENDLLSRCTKKRFDPNDNLVFEQGPCLDSYFTYEYDAMNRLVKECEVFPSGRILEKRYAYDACSNKVAAVDIYGNETNYKYDELGRLIELIHPPTTNSKGECIRATEKYLYNTLNQLVEKIDAQGNSTRYNRNIRGDILDVEHPDGTSEHYRYSLEGWLVKEMNRQGVATTYEQDEQGRIINTSVYSETGELLKKTFSTYNAFHLLSETDALGYVTHYQYDFAGRLTAKTKENKKSEYTYDLQNRLRHIIDHCAGSQRITLRDYDLLGQVLQEKVEDDQGTLYSKTSFSYDAKGNCSSTLRETDHGSALTVKDYDTHGQLTRIVDAEGNESTAFNNYYHFNDEGQKVACRVEIDAQKNKTLTILDAMQRVNRVVKVDSEGVTLHTTLFHYDVKGNLEVETEVVYSLDAPPRRYVLTRKYDAMNRLVRLSEGDGHLENKITEYAYTANGQRSKIIKPDGTILNYTYDSLGRLLELSSSDGSVHYTYIYDLNDNLLSVYDVIQKQTTYRQYDAFGNCLQETLGHGQSLYKSYDAFDRPLVLTLPDSTQVHYAYNSVHLTTVTRTGKIAYQHRYSHYDLNGKIATSQLPFQLGEINTTYNLNGQCTILTSPHYREETTFDIVGNVKERGVQNDKYGYTYDNLYNLTSESGKITHRYSFDSLRNRISKDETPYSLNSLNQLLQENETRYTYDLNGNLIEEITAGKKLTYSYDALNRLTSAKTPSGDYQYTYDAFNRRLSKTSGNTTSYYLYEGNNEIGLINSEGKIEELRILGLGLGAEIGAAVVLELHDKVFIPIHDSFGNIVQILDMQGTIVESLSYTVYGEETNATFFTPWRFSSKRVDPETGLLYFGERYYNPKTGRWTTPDPAEFMDGNNIYAYIHNNPLKYIDPDGRVAFVLCFFSIGFSAAELTVAIASIETIASAVCTCIVGVVLYEVATTINDHVQEDVVIEDEGKLKSPYPFPGNDPTKCPAEGFVWNGTGVPGSKEGSWYNDNTDESLRSDLNHGKPIGPHWDYSKGNKKNGEVGRIYPDGTYIKK
ncbi:MAG: RHS repeat-associated core domain-containing protein [Parachlamydiales bacterium]|jgi:RHS repeat-associated protein